VRWWRDSFQRADGRLLTSVPKIWIPTAECLSPRYSITAIAIE
jgi:hypothetical protein